MFGKHTFNLLLPVDVNLQPIVLTVYSHHSELEILYSHDYTKRGFGFIVDFNLLMYK